MLALLGPEISRPVGPGDRVVWQHPRPLPVWEVVAVVWLHKPCTDSRNMLKYDCDWEQAKLLDDHAAFPKGGYFKWEKEFQAQL